MWGYLKQYLPPGPYTKTNLGLALLPVLIALVLLIIENYGLQDAFIRDYGAQLSEKGFDSNDIRFFAQVNFSSFCVILLIAAPVLFHFAFPSQLNNPFGFSIKHCGPHWPVYGLLLLIMIPVAWIASGYPGFHEFYPMYKPVSISMWMLYEAVYMTQFFCVEFFFRGIALFRLEARFGYHAVTMMMVPYALFHIHKPFPEALASIVAGLVLGLLALKSRSIWPGVLVHCGVAYSMDLFALIRSGRLALLFA